MLAGNSDAVADLADPERFGIFSGEFYRSSDFPNPMQEKMTNGRFRPLPFSSAQIQ